MCEPRHNKANLIYAEVKPLINEVNYEDKITDSTIAAGNGDAGILLSVLRFHSCVYFQLVRLSTMWTD